MEATELIEIVSRGEDSRHQFKENVHNVDSLAAEIVAFANSGGGLLIIGVDDDYKIAGLESADLRRLNQLISNAASQSVRPAVNPITSNVSLPEGLVIVIDIPDGISKPYMDNAGAIWVKSGSDKRKVTSREEMQRMFQAAGLIHGDEVPANGMSIADIDMPYFEAFFQREYGESLKNQLISFPKILENMNLCKDSTLNLAGALLFSQRPHLRLPVFIIKAVSYPGTDIHSSQYLDSRDINGRIADMYQQSISFIRSQLRRIQDNQGINSIGNPEIPDSVFEELLVNALLHRDYFVSAPIRVLVFADRIEIISPGHLPNNLTIENIKSGNSNIRNPILSSFATRLLPYRGIGSGIRNALKAYPNIDFEDDKDNNLFRVIIKRPAS